MACRVVDYRSKGLGFDTLPDFLKVWKKILPLYHGFPEPLGTKCHGLDSPVIRFQHFVQINFGAVLLMVPLSVGTSRFIPASKSRMTRHSD